jgi:hypothetical protein
MFSQAPPARHAPIPTAEGSQITQDKSADATNARQLENPVDLLEYFANVVHGLSQI